MIIIKNTQRKIKIDLKAIKKDAQTILDALDYSDYDLGIWLTSVKKMHELNQDYRHKDKATDILSFPYHPTLKAGERIKIRTDEDKNVGDVIICPEYVHDDLPRWNQDFETRMKVLLVHGICHLLGYDHIKDEEYKVMKRKEEQLLKKIAHSS